MSFGQTPQLRVGSLFAGMGGLDLAVHEVFAAETAWFCEHEPPTEKNPRPRDAAARVLAHRFPDAPNHGDVTAVDWATDVEPVDILCGGYPCVSQSQAGLRLGQDDDRWLWPAYRAAIRALRPRIAVGENVEGHVQMDLRTVIADLQRDGYAAVWVTLAASDVGACHRRRRVFWLAWPEEYGAPVLPRWPFAWLGASGWGVDDLLGWSDVDGWAYQGAAYQGAAYQGAAPAPSLLPTPRTTDTNGTGAHGDGGLDLRTAINLLPTPNAALGDTHRGGWPNPEVAAARRAQGKRFLDDAISVLLSTPTVTDSRGGRNATAVRSDPSSGHHAGTTLTDAVWQPKSWAQYAAAIAKHESVLGRPAPPPTGPHGRNGEQRLDGRFCEWMMMLPDGWITDVPGISNKDAIKLCGNGVVPAQAAAALRHLLTITPAGLLGLVTA